MALDDQAEFRRRVRYAVIFAGAGLLSAWLIWVAREVLILLFAAVLCSVCLDTSARWVCRSFRVSRAVAVFLVVLLGCCMLALAIGLRGAAIRSQVERFGWIYL